MAKLEGYLLLTGRQIDEIKKGHMVTVYREGEALTVGLKTKHSEEAKIRSELNILRSKLRDLHKGNGNDDNHP